MGGAAARTSTSPPATCFIEKNAVSFLPWAPGTGAWHALMAFLMPTDLGFFLTCVAPGLRPAPGRQPPLRPLTPDIAGGGGSCLWWQI